MLKILNLSKTYKGGKKAVSNLNIEVEAGDIFGFIGHNGAGKTTTLKCIMGILDFEEGEIYINGHSLKDDEIYCKKISAYIGGYHTNPLFEFALFFILWQVLPCLNVNFLF